MICIAIEKVLSFVICIANIPGLWILSFFPLFPSLLPVVATENERIWFCQKAINFSSFVFVVATGRHRKGACMVLSKGN